MKRILVAFFLTIMIGLHCKCQKMDFLLGGLLGFKYSNSKPEETSAASAFNGNSNTFMFSGSPLFGYFISDNINAGLAFEFKFQNTNYKDGGYDYIKQTDFIVSPFVRYYINSLFLIGQANIGNSRSKIKGDIQVDDFNGGYQTVSLDSDLKHIIYGFGIGLGYDFSLTDHIKLEPIIRYLYNIYSGIENADDNKNSDILINIGLVYTY